MILTPKSVWYLAHPVAADKQYTTQQNLDHILVMLKTCWQEGFRVFAPYHTMCHVFSESTEYRQHGLEADCELVRRLGLMICVGHKLSSGMRLEAKALGELDEFYCLDFTGVPDRYLAGELRQRYKVIIPQG